MYLPNIYYRKHFTGMCKLRRFFFLVYKVLNKQKIITIIF